MTEKHIAARFDREFSALASRVMALGGLVEAQTRMAVQALLACDISGAQDVVNAERRVDALERDIDRELASAIGRRQPKATELRLLTAMARTTSNLERAGDEAERIALGVRTMAARPPGEQAYPAAELAAAGELAALQLRRALDALARLDADDALQVLQADRALDEEFRRFLASATARMAREPGCVRAGVDLVLAARALERIGDHATNIAECIIYIVRGADVRHADLQPPGGARPRG